MNKKLRSVLSMVLCLLLVSASLVACNNNTDDTSKPNPDVTPATYKQAEYNTTTATMPSNWNELTYADNNDTQIMNYIGSSFFDYDYKFENNKKYNDDGSINKAGIVPGAYTTNFSAATKLEDVTSSVDAKWGYTDAQKKEGGYAWKITLRDDLKWDDGTAIKAADFVYSMKQQLDPAFMNFRANTFYDTLKIKNSKVYFFQNQEGTYETVASLGYATNADASASMYTASTAPKAMLTLRATHALSGSPSRMKPFTIPQLHGQPALQRTLSPVSLFGKTTLLISKSAATMLNMQAFMSRTPPAT